MLISPPFLPAPQAGETDDQFIERAMSIGDFGDGSFPLSYDRNWHGGVHLTAPQADGAALPVRAIADGMVVFVQPPTPRSTDLNHAQNYRNGWTDNGCVIIRHQTEIGAQGNTPTSVTFFSIYMHLRQIAGAIQQDHAVFRKDEIGNAGSISGVADRIHFEIICDDTNIRAITGRTTMQFPSTGDGRTDAVYGGMWFELPQGTQFHAAQHGSQPPDPAALPPIVFTVPAGGIRIYMQFVRSSAGLQAYSLDQAQRAWRTLGTQQAEHDFEYTFYNTALARYPHSPSAGSELLRFGRVLGPDPLQPPNAPHWRLISFAQGQVGWVNLNAPNVRKYSDADFPNWFLIDATRSADSRCTDINVFGPLDINRDRNVPPEEALRALPDPAVQAQLGLRICKMPTDWDASTVARRFGWLQREPVPTRQGRSQPMNGRDFGRFTAHATALCFWQQAQARLGIDANHWHFHPKAFVRHFRKCGWLSRDELAQCIPRTIAALNGTAFANGPVANWANATTRATHWAPHVNRSIRKYLISATPQRLAHFLAQVFAESGFLQLVREGGGERQQYAPYYGRGLIQITHEAGYRRYGEYRGFATTHPNTAPPFGHLGWNPDDLIARGNAPNAHDPANCADSAGYYWTSRPVTATGQSGLEVADAGIALADIISASRLVNGGVALQNINGLDHRIGSLLYLKYVLLDFIRPTPAMETLQFDWRRDSHQEPVLDANGRPVIGRDGHPRHAFVLAHHTVNFPLNPQRP